MKFNLKLFVLVGILAGFRDVCGTEKKEENKDDGFIVEGLVDNEEEANALKVAMDGKRVIKAVYKKWNRLYDDNVCIIDSNFKDQLSYILVCHGKNVVKVETEALAVSGGNFCYNMQKDVEYTVYFIFKDVGVKSTRNMFLGCINLISADLMFFNALNVINMFDMFSYCSLLTQVFLPSKDAKIKKRCICCGDEYVCWNNREVGGLEPKKTVRKS